MLGLNIDAKPKTHIELNKAGFESENLNIFWVFGLFSIKLAIFSEKFILFIFLILPRI